MRELLMKMKSALVGLVLGGLSAMTIRDWPALASPSIETLIRQVERASRYRPAFNGGLPSVKRAQRLAKDKRATRRARRLGHA
ncbi:hypothetical protein ACV1C8_10165 [Aeromonas hydrophila]